MSDAQKTRCSLRVQRSGVSFFWIRGPWLARVDASRSNLFVNEMKPRHVQAAAAGAHLTQQRQHRRRAAAGLPQQLRTMGGRAGKGNQEKPGKNSGETLKIARGCSESDP